MKSKSFTLTPEGALRTAIRRGCQHLYFTIGEHIMLVKNLILLGIIHLVTWRFAEQMCLYVMCAMMILSLVCLFTNFEFLRGHVCILSLALYWQTFVTVMVAHLMRWDNSNSPTTMFPIICMILYKGQWKSWWGHILLVALNAAIIILILWFSPGLIHSFR